MKLVGDLNSFVSKVFAFLFNRKAYLYSYGVLGCLCASLLIMVM